MSAHENKAGHDPPGSAANDARKAREASRGRICASAMKRRKDCTTVELGQHNLEERRLTREASESYLNSFVRLLPAGLGP